MVFAPLSLIAGMATRDALLAGFVLRGLLLVVQWGATGVVQVGIAASLVALVRSELREMAA